MLAVALAVGALYELARAWLMPADAADAAVEAYLDFVAGGSDLALRTDDPASLQHWFATQLGQQAFPTPPMPAGFKLVGGGKADLGEVDAAMLVYAADRRGRPAPDAAVRPGLPPDGAQTQAAAPIPVETGGYHQLVWQTDPYSFRLVSAEPPARLHEFARYPFTRQWRHLVGASAPCSRTHRADIHRSSSSSSLACCRSGASNPSLNRP